MTSRNTRQSLSIPTSRRVHPPIGPILGTELQILRGIARSVDMSSWWERYPEALAAELAAWDSIGNLGYTWKEDEATKASGRLVIHIELKRGSETLRFTAVYPDTFPYFQAHVRLDSEQLARHHNPVNRNLCLIGREGEGWRPGHDTTASLLAEKFPVIAAINAGVLSNDEVNAKEDHVGEPASSFLEYAHDCTIIVPDQTPPQEVEVGRLTLVVRPKPVDRDDRLFLTGALQLISDIGQRTLVQFPASIPAFSSRLSGFWIRLPERPKVDDGLPKRLHDLISEKVPAFRTALRHAKRGQFVIAGFVYPDEVSWRQCIDDWIFIAAQVVQEEKRSRPASFAGHFIRADWGGEDAWLRRAPALRPMRQKSALLVGVGALGSPVAVHLARAGLSRLHLVDCDHLQVGNTVRWALGWRFAGFEKVEAMKAFMADEYPYTRIDFTRVRLGVPVLGEQPASDYDAMYSLVSAADIVIDASANQRVSHFLADLTTELQKPYLWLTTTPGAAGGVVGRVIPGTTDGCWHCFQHSLGDGTIRQPADLGAKDTQPAGCSQPTYIGAGIDSDEIALLGARLAVATLCRGGADGYADFSWDVAIADLARAGVSIAPDWTTHMLTRNKSCAGCNPKR